MYAGVPTTIPVVTFGASAIRARLDHAHRAFGDRFDDAITSVEDHPCEIGLHSRTIPQCDTQIA
jgi:hypothetical protein